MRGRLDRKRVGAAKLAARQKRIATIRARVVACSVLIFAALWFAVFTQLVIGRDPALAVKARAHRHAAMTRARLDARRRQRAVIDLGKLRAHVARPRHRTAPSAPVTPEPAPAAAPPPPQPQPAPAPPPVPTPVTTSQS